VALGVSGMSETRRVGCTGAVQRLSLWLVGAAAAVALADAPPVVVDSQSIISSLKPSGGPMTRGLVVAPRTPEGGGGSHKVALDIRFANDSERLTPAAHAQLAQLGAALSAPELSHARFQIAGHTSASGAAEHNRRLSEARARAVRSYLLENFKIAPERIEATGYGSSRPRSEYPPNAVQQRRVEISTLPPAS
jgi:OmpA-OmpF porin, OOP family